MKAHPKEPAARREGKRRCYLETFNDGGRYWRGRVVALMGGKVVQHFSGWFTRKSLIADMTEWAEKSGRTVTERKP